MLAENSDLRSLLDFIREARGFDFTGYKRTTLSRRIGKRMAAVGADGYPEYAEYLEVNADEFGELFNAILINVTSFFRDKPAWDYLASDVVPELLRDREDSEPIRIWSAGCASGEEAYTLVMVLAEALGDDAYKRRVKVYATDVDEDALQAARQASYPTAALDDVPAELRGKYFEPNSAGHQQFRGDLRRTVIFGRNDMVQDAPISRIDLLVSRNVLMYFTAETQSRILTRFNFALRPHGYMFVGKAEMLLSHTELFAPVDMKARVFRKVPGGNLRDRLALAGGGAEGVVARIGERRYEELLAGAASLLPIAAVVVDSDGFVTEINQRARDLFKLGLPDVGRPLRDLDISYRPADLRTAIDKAAAERRTMTMGRFPWPVGGGPDARTLDVKVIPVVGGEGPLGVVVSFEDVTLVSRLTEDYERARVELENAYEELQSTVEELETTNEELQSTNEELETTNEELQSTNEELETMNEELQSSNEELETMNDEQNNRSQEMDRVNMFLEAILGSLGVSVVVVDRDQRIEVWNAASRELWGLRADEAEGRSFMALDIGLPIDQLAEPLRKTLAGAGQPEVVLLDAVNRRGKPFRCAVRMLPLESRSGEVQGAVILTGDADEAGKAVPVSTG